SKLRLEGGEADAARLLARSGGTTLFSTLLAVLQVLLRRWTGQRDLVVATPVANRPRGFEGTVGYFVGQVAIRGELGLAASYREVQEQARDRTVEALDHSALPFAEVVELLGVRRDPGRAPLCDVGFALESPPMDRRGVFSVLMGDPGATLELGGKSWEGVDLPQQEGQLDLNFHLLDRGEGLGGLVAYDSALFDASTVDRLLRGFRRLVVAAAAEPDRPVGHLLLLCEAERRQLSVLGSGGEREPRSGSLLSWVLDHCRRGAGAPAVEGAGSTLSYGDLDTRSEALARRLREHGVGPESVVAVLEEPSPELAVALLAVHRAGGAYLPLDPKNPPERLRYMLGEGQGEVEALALSATFSPAAGGRDVALLLTRREVLETVFPDGLEDFPVLFQEPGGSSP
ncbi:MAG: AMP-binding protein, partial [Acidobacteria bacterium]|nr:AMP-binding protein [Acidobacteriota bacterium]